MPILNYSIANSVLTESDKARIICLYFSTNETTSGIDWKKATNDYGSANVESFKKLFSNMHKKIKAIESGAGAASVELNGIGTPPSSPKKAGTAGRKRKNQASGGRKKRGPIKVEMGNDCVGEEGIVAKGDDCPSD